MPFSLNEHAINFKNTRMNSLLKKDQNIYCNLLLTGTVESCLDIASATHTRADISVCKSIYMHTSHARPVTTVMNVVSVLTRRASISLRNDAVGCLELKTDQESGSPNWAAQADSGSQNSHMT